MPVKHRSDMPSHLRLVPRQYAQMELMAAIGEAVHRLRTENKLTQAQLQELARVDQGAVSKIEKGKRGVSFDSLERIAMAFGLTSSQLMAMAEARAKGGEILTPEKLAEPADGDRTLGLVINQLENDIDALRHALGSLMVVTGLHRPREGAEIAAGILASAPKKFHDQGMTKAFLDALPPASPQTAAAPSEPRRVARGR